MVSHHNQAVGLASAAGQDASKAHLFRKVYDSATGDAVNDEEEAKQ